MKKIVMTRIKSILSKKILMWESEIKDELTGIRIIELVGIAIFLFFFSYFSLHWAIETIIHSRKEQIVPDIMGRSAMRAIEILSERNLAIRKEGVEFDESVPIGAVLRQNPPPGTQVREGKTVRVVFSQGGAAVFVPVLIGLPLRNAELLLRRKQLLLGEISEAYSLRSKKGIVMFQDPWAESSVAKNTMMNVVVSAGPPPSGIVLMPDFRQRQLSQAMRWASENAFFVEVRDNPDSLFPNGTILGQEPGPDTVLGDDTEISITASSRMEIIHGRELVHRIHYEVSQSGSQSQIRIIIVDRQGEREIFNGFRDPGTKVDLTVPHGGAAKVRIFVNGVLVEERELE